MIEIIQQRAKCIGCAYCVLIAPNRWYMDKMDGKASMYEAVFTKNNLKVITTDDELNNSIETQNVCPVKIVTVRKIK